MACLSVFHTALGLLIAAAAAWGCSAPANGTGGNDAAGGSAGLSEAVVGSFAAKLIAADPATGTPAFTDVSGSVHDGPQPSALAWTVVGAANGCTVRTPRAPFCDPACGSEGVCTEDGTCKPHPKAQDVGTVRVQGLGAAEFVMELTNGAYHQPPLDANIPNPPCPEGADVRIQASGGATVPFVVQGKGILPLVLSGTGPIALKPDLPLKLEWAGPGNPELSRVTVRIDISHHGGFRGDIECDVTDSGSLEIPATLIGELIALGVSGFPSIVVTRRSTGATTIPSGRVLLTISSSVERDVDIPGLISCNDVRPCPAGQTCQVDRRCK